MATEGKAAVKRLVKVAATQMSCSLNHEENIKLAVRLVTKAANLGANIILLQELFERVYFCQEEKAKYFEWAHVDSAEDRFLKTFSNLAKELQVVLPISFFEKVHPFITTIYLYLYYNQLFIL